jgi:hypothetical protein
VSNIGRCHGEGAEIRGGKAEKVARSEQCERDCRSWGPSALQSSGGGFRVCMVAMGMGRCFPSCARRLCVEPPFGIAADAHLAMVYLLHPRRHHPHLPKVNSVHPVRSRPEMSAVRVVFILPIVTSRRTAATTIPGDLPITMTFGSTFSRNTFNCSDLFAT